LRVRTEVAVLDIEVTGDEGCTIFHPVGELDAFTVAMLRERLAGLGAVSALVVDLSDVPFIDSSGLGALIGGIRRARELGGDVAVVCARPSVNRLLATTGFDRIASVTPSFDEALAVLSRTGDHGIQDGQ
jgi:anti-sigma B factor antagonist